MTFANKDHQQSGFNPLNAVNLAAKKITPTWPLDQSIAVNPWWQLRTTEMTETAATLRFLGNIRLLMPKKYYYSLWLTEISEQNLNEAKSYFDVTADTQELLAYLDKPETHKHWEHISDFLDDQVSHQYKISWREEVLQQISNFCAFYLNFPDNFGPQSTASDGFYKAWRASTIADKGMQILTGENHLHEIFLNLPDNADDLLNQHYKQVTSEGVDETAWQDYVYALLLDVNGWASWLAYGEWQASLYERDNPPLLRQLVIIRMAWDWVLWQNTLMTDTSLLEKLKTMFTSQLHGSRSMQLQSKQENTFLWVWHKATEINFQQAMHQKLSSALSQPVKKPILQAVFCIDVRSEQYRRQLEAQNIDIETSGFAGFFGLPIAFKSKAGNTLRAQLPGLLKPSLIAQQPIPASEVIQIQAQLKNKLSWKLASDSSPSSFGMVESQGLFKVFDLLKQSLFGSNPSRVIPTEDAEHQWEITSGTSTLDTEALTALAKAIIGGIGLTTPYAENILIVGHGSFSANNPHASSLDCGACGGQTGEVNALVLCHLLNRKEIRKTLNSTGASIPDSTTFVPCLHNTVTDEIIVLNSQRGVWLDWLNQATVSCQKHRVISDGNLPNDPQKVQQALTQRTKDWAQLRPEWGLVNNASFVVAPRADTKGIDFEGRSFLHDYAWKNDSKFDLLELIMTAPMIVTNWINLHYYASVTDNQHYGSGNKMLHNVVDGNFGVFEGNGGDLRIGLPQQSIHDGVKWRHSPIRLNVYIAAPRNAIKDIIDKHPMVKDLLENNWLFLFQWDLDTRAIWRYEHGDWQKS
ncbi:MAG: hypothetical protein ACI9QV_000541 [Methylophagaceae bacterium]|jgi:uncharacterized protein YbcC (UPF0753/DUF2309 family)